MKLSEYVLYWLNNFKKRSVKESTYDRLYTSYTALCKYDISNMEIQDITATEIQNYINTLADTYSYSVVKKMFQIVSAPLSKAAAMHQISCNPSVGVELPNRQNVAKMPRTIEAYNMLEQARLRKVLNTRERKGYDVILFMLETGLRIGECLALEWTDINFNRKCIRIHKTLQRLANKKESKVSEGAKSFTSNRLVPLSREAERILLQLKEESSTQWVFEDENGDILSYEAVRYQTQVACKKAGVPYKGEHVFRHTFATNVYNASGDIKILSKVLGHSSTQITYDIYVNLYDDGLEQMKKIFRPS